MPLFGVWVYSGREPEVDLPSGTTLSLTREFKKGLVAGVDPSSPTYWGDMQGKYSHGVVEAADIALSTWLFRDAVWSGLSESDRTNVVQWLTQVNQCAGADNNWHLFYVLIDRVLSSLGYENQIDNSQGRYERIKDFHLGDGWFKDGPQGEVDYYNAWGFHYALYWIDHIDPEWDPDFIRECQRKFLSTYKFLIGPNGFPILGRSVPYRIAAPAPLVFGCSLHPDVVNEGEARRALDSTWCYFIRHGAVQRGTITQGYFGPDVRLLDAYSGPASSLWSLRSLIVALGYPRDSSFWRTESTSLPIERCDYEITLKGPDWRVYGNKDTNQITIEIPTNSSNRSASIDGVSFKRKILSVAYQDGNYRPGNKAAKYNRRYYHSEPPFMTENSN